MAASRQKNIVERLADAGEEAIERIASIAAADKGAWARSGRCRSGSTSCRRACAAIEQLEKRLSAIEGGSTSSRARASTKSPQDILVGLEEEPPPRARPAPAASPGRGPAAPAGRPRSARASCPAARRRAGSAAAPARRRVTSRAAEQLGLRVGQMRAAEDLRHRQHEVALREVADQQHVERAVVRARLRADLHPAAEVRAVGDDDVVHAGVARLAVDRDVDLAVRPAREHGERRPDVRDLPAERLRRVVGALRDRAAHPGAADVREPATLPRRRPSAGRSRGRGRSCASVPRERDLDRRGRRCAGSRASGRSPSRCRAGSPRSRRPSRPAIPFTTSFTEPSPPTTTSSSAPSSAARRASSVSSPGRP